MNETTVIILNSIFKGPHLLLLLPQEFHGTELLLMEFFWGGICDKEIILQPQITQWGKGKRTKYGLFYRLRASLFFPFLSRPYPLLATTMWKRGALGSMIRQNKHLIRHTQEFLLSSMTYTWRNRLRAHTLIVGRTQLFAKQLGISYSANPGW